MFSLHLVFVGNSVLLIEQLVHLAGGVGHELDLQPALFHVHAYFVVDLEREDHGVHFLEQGADDPGHDHELVGAEVDVRFDAGGFVHDVQAAQVVALEGLHALRVVTFRKHD